MSKSNMAAAAPAFPLAGILGIVFITLRLCHVIDWAWLWVLAPFWMPLAAALAFLVVLCVVFLVWQA